MITFADMFKDPSDAIAPLIGMERETGLDELELVARGMMLNYGEQVDAEGDIDG